jgi:hypothetical protein
MPRRVKLSFKITSAVALTRPSDSELGWICIDVIFIIFFFVLKNPRPVARAGRLSFGTLTGSGRLSRYHQPILVKNTLGHVFMESFADRKAKVVTLAFLFAVLSWERDKEPEFSFDHSYAVNHKLAVQDDADKSFKGIILLLIA